jgi:hypothetical protein
MAHECKVDDTRASEPVGVPTPWMTSAEAAAYVRCSPRTLEGYRNAGGGPVYHRSGGRVFYHRDDLDAWRHCGRAENTLQERLSGALRR